MENWSIILKLSEIVGAPEPALRLLISLLFGYPIAFVHRKYLYGKDAHLQHLYFIATGCSLGYFNFGFEIFHAVFTVFFTYLTLVIFGGTILAVAFTFVFNMSYLLIGYYYSGTNNYDINWTVPQCVLVLRLIATSFNLYDGKQSSEQLSAENQKVALEKTPGILEFFGHMFFPASFLIGPQFPLKRLRQFVAGDFGIKDKSKPPDSVSYAARRFALGVMYLCIYQVIGTHVTDDYITSDEYVEQSCLKRLFLLGVWGRVTLYKYMSCWLFSEGACILFGVSYNGQNKKDEPTWNGLENVKPWLLENATEFNHYIQSFNVNTNSWVAQYIYKRLKFLGNRHISQASVLLFLAVWHGFHSGYYVCFIFEFLVMYLEKDLQSILKTNESLTNFLNNDVVKVITYLLLRIYTFVFMGWCLLPFALLTYERYWRAFSAVNYVGLFMYIPWPILYSPLVRLLVGKRKLRHRDD